MRFSNTFIDDLRRQTDIVRVIGNYVQLKKKGANWMACCPFHGEKSASFSVSPTKDIYYCFGCGKGGSVFSFVMEIERVSFPEAVKIVAEQSGVALPQAETGARADEQKKADEARKQASDDVIKLNGYALEWWEAQLAASNGEARACREYIERRGISDETRRVFRIGFAPNNWDGLLNHLRERGATDKQLEASGLVIKKDTGGFYDRFRARVIFPVLDVRGRAVAFGGRTMRVEDEPKYLNSPETAAYIKGRHLYGLFQANADIKRRRFVILVEGYLDLCVLYQAGVENVVASLGTSLTEAQAKLLVRFARKVVVNYDGDKAGIAAARRATETLLTEGFEVKVLVLPNNVDPDEFIKTAGVEDYHKRRGQAKSHIQFLLDESLRDRDLQRPADKAAAVEEIMPSLRAVKNPIQRREYFDLAMDTLRVDATLRGQLWEAVGRGEATNRNSSRYETSEFVRIVAAPPTIAEQQLLEILINDAEIRRAFVPHIVTTDYAKLPTEIIFATLIELENKGEFDANRLAALTASDLLASDLVPMLMMADLERAEGESADDLLMRAESCLQTLRLISVDNRLRELGVEIAHAERLDDTTRLRDLMMERLELTRRRATLLPRTTAVNPTVNQTSL